LKSAYRASTRQKKPRRRREAQSRSLNRPGGLDIWFTQGARAQEIARLAGNDLKAVFRGVMSQDYYLACNLNLQKEEFHAMSAALAAMKKDGSFQQLMTELP
jgi:hypothetical protein